MEQLDAVDAAGEGLGVREGVQAFVGGPDMDDAAEALAIGLANRVVAEGQALAAAQALVTTAHLHRKCASC